MKEKILKYLDNYDDIVSIYLQAFIKEYCDIFYSSNKFVMYDNNKIYILSNKSIKETIYILLLYLTKNQFLSTANGFIEEDYSRHLGCYQENKNFKYYLNENKYIDVNFNFQLSNIEWQWRFFHENTKINFKIPFMRCINSKDFKESGVLGDIDFYVDVLSEKLINVNNILECDLDFFFSLPNVFIKRHKKFFLYYFSLILNKISGHYKHGYDNFIEENYDENFAKIFYNSNFFLDGLKRNNNFDFNKYEIFKHINNNSILEIIPYLDFKNQVILSRYLKKEKITQ